MRWKPAPSTAPVLQSPRIQCQSRLNAPPAAPFAVLLKILVHLSSASVMTHDFTWLIIIVIKSLADHWPLPSHTVKCGLAMEGNMEMKEWTVVSRRRPGKKGDIDLTPTSKDARHSVVLRRVGTAPKGPAAPKGTKNKPPTDAVANSAATASKASKISWAVRSKQTVQSAKAGNTTRSKKARQAHPAQVRRCTRTSQGCIIRI